MIVLSIANELEEQIIDIATDFILEREEIIMPYLITVEHFNKIKINPFLTKGKHKLIDTLNAGRVKHSLEDIFKYYNNTSKLMKDTTHNISFINNHAIRKDKYRKEYVDKTILGLHNRSFN